MNNIRPSLKKRISLNAFNKFVKAHTEVHDLTYLFWECTLRCNLSCEHCGSDCRSSYDQEDMSKDVFLKAVRRIKEQYDPNKLMIIITGGEPLVRKDLEEIGLELYKEGFPWGIVSNGMGISKNRLKKLLNAGMRTTTISLDGLEESHNWLRKSNKSFNKALSAITMITKEDQLDIDVVTCINQRNINELPALRDLLVSRGVKNWRIFSIAPIGRAKENPDLNLTNQQFRDLMEFLKETRKSGQIHVSFGCEGFLGNYESEVRDGYYFCRAGINIGSILADGTICACPNINNTSFGQGNIYTDDFLDVWNTKFEVMRDRSWTKKGMCGDCEAYKWCKGNSIHLHEDTESGVMRCHYKMLNEA